MFFFFLQMLYFHSLTKVGQRISLQCRPCLSYSGANLDLNRRLEKVCRHIVVAIQGYRGHCDDNRNMPVIEVERKFVPSDDTEPRLQTLGGRLVQRYSFHDVYMDTLDYRLTSNDHWLRQRDGQWQLKCPPATGVAPLSQATSQYSEWQDDMSILQHVLPLLQDSTNPLAETAAKSPDDMQCCPSGNTDTSPSSIQEMLSSGKWCEIARFTTHRSSYTLGDFSIDLDSADFGLQVGEIETLVSHESQIAEAIVEIDKLANKLGR